MMGSDWGRIEMQVPQRGLELVGGSQIGAQFAKMPLQCRSNPAKLFTIDTILTLSLAKEEWARYTWPRTRASMFR